MDYSKFSLTELVNRIGISRYFDLPKILKATLLKIPTDSRPYKVYTAKLTQSGTDAPEVVVSENTFDDTITWEYLSTGKYTGTFSNTVFDFDKINLLISSVAFGKTEIAINSPSVVLVSSLDDTPVFADDILVETFIEIRLYN